MTPDLHDLSIAELSRLIAARKLSPVELVEALIQRVEQYDAQTRAFITRTFDLARRQARQAEAEIAAGRLARRRCTASRSGSRTSTTPRASSPPRTRASSSTGSRPRTRPRPRKLYEAGAVLLGKLATHEMAHAGPSFDLPWPPARNPWNLAHFTGGSSTGSGAAVAAGLRPGGARLRHRRLDPRPGVALRRRRPHAHVRAGEPRRRHHQLLHVRPLRSRWPGPSRTARSLLQALAGYDPKDAGQPAAADPALSRGARPGSARAPDRRAAPPLGGGHPGVRGRAQGHGRRARRAARGSAPSSRSAACGRSAPTTTSRSSSPRPRSSASISRT